MQPQEGLQGSAAPPGSTGSIPTLNVEPLHHPEDMAHIEVPHNVENIPHGTTVMNGKALLAKKMAATGSVFVTLKQLGSVLLVAHFSLLPADILFVSFCLIELLSTLLQTLWFLPALKSLVRKKGNVGQIPSELIHYLQFLPHSERC
jgi:hypothetical protein